MVAIVKDGVANPRIKVGGVRLRSPRVILGKEDMFVVHNYILLMKSRMTYHTGFGCREFDQQISITNLYSQWAL